MNETKGTRPRNVDDYASLDALGLAEFVSDGEISVEELVQASLHAIEAANLTIKQSVEGMRRRGAHSVATAI